MSYLESLKEMYNSIKPEMFYCGFAPNLDADKWEAILNSLAPQEEPVSVLCIGKAKLKGFFSDLDASSFLLTNEKLYMEKIKEGMKFSEILSISYSEEEKRTLLGTTKLKGFITIEKTSGKKENLKGNYATKEIAEFLNKVVAEFKTNPPPVTYKDSQNVSKIADIIKANIKGDEKHWKIVPDITDKEITSFVIHFAKDEMKSCFAAIYENYSGEKLYFTNDCLYYKKSDKLNKVKYENLSNASYCEKRKKEENKIIFSRNVTLYDKNNKVIFEALSENDSVLSSETSNNLEKNLADIFNNIISLTTGKDVKTEVRKEKDVFFTLLEKWDEFFSSINLSEPIEIQVTEHEVIASDTNSTEGFEKQMPVYLCKTANNCEFEYADKVIDRMLEFKYEDEVKYQTERRRFECSYFKFIKKDTTFSMHIYFSGSSYRMSLDCSLLEEPVYYQFFDRRYFEHRTFSKIVDKSRRMRNMGFEGLWDKRNALISYLRSIQDEKELQLKQVSAEKHNQILNKLDEI